MIKITGKHIALVFIVSLFLALSACSSKESAEPLTEPLALTIVASDIAYETTRIDAGVEQRVQLTFDNQGVLEHDFTIVKIPLAGEVIMSMPAGEMGDHDMDHMTEHPDLHVVAASGSRSTIEFVPSTPGEYVFYCTVSGHREAGMEGVLVIY